MAGSGTSGSVEFREFAGRFGGNSRELKVKMRLRRILDGNGDPANGSGTLSFVQRITLEDRVVTSPGMGTDLTIIDFPAPLAFVMTDGNATLTFPGSTCGLICFNIDPLPGCTSIEFMQLKILDPNGNPFAVPGVFFKDLPN